ncbi:MAG: flagellar hook-length control protein FliK [bacterium]
MVSSLVNTLRQSQQKSSAASGSGQEDGIFAQMLEEQAKKSEKEESKESNKFISSEKKEEEKGRENAPRKKESREELRSLHNFLYNMLWMDKDAMSLAQKQSLHLGDPLLGDIGLTQLQKMLAQRGLKLQELTSEQITQLMHKNDKWQLAAYLDDMVKDRGRKDRADGGQMVARPEADPSQKTPEMKNLSAQTNDRGGADNTREEVMQQVIQHLEILKLQDATQVIMKLNPAFLGELGLKMEVEGSRVTARFETTSKQTREFLEESLKELEKAFSDKGLRVGRVLVNLVEKIA